MTLFARVLNNVIPRQLTRIQIPQEVNRTRFHKAYIQDCLILIRYINLEEKPTISTDFGRFRHFSLIEAIKD